MTLVAGVDSSTQSCKVVIRDADTGALVREGRAVHPDGTEVDPAAWWTALGSALHEAGGLDDVAGLSVAAQQHGMVCLDAAGDVVRPALLWNDTRSAPDAAALVSELGGGDALAGAKVWARSGRFGTGGLVHRDKAAVAREAASRRTPRAPPRFACRTIG